MSKLLFYAVALGLALIAPPTTATNERDAPQFSRDPQSGMLQLLDQGEVIWQTMSDTGIGRVHPLDSNRWVIILTFEPNFEIGDAVAILFDRVNRVELEELEFMHFEKVEREGDSLVIFSRFNKHGFMSPMNIIWPIAHVASREGFEVSVDPKHYDFPSLKKDTASFIGDMYAVCDGRPQDCALEPEYRTAVRQLRDLSDNVVCGTKQTNCRYEPGEAADEPGE